MGPGVVVLVVVLVAIAAYVWLATPLPSLLVFYIKLYLAHRQAERFYAECPWVSKNIAYHAITPRRLDVYRPETGSGHPVIIYVYGGGWNSGNKELYAPAAQRFLPEGFVLVMPDYTLFPSAGYPRQTEEIAAAIAWTLEHVAEFGGDPGRVVVVAQSAGAQVSGLTVMEPRWLAVHGHSTAELRGFIAISGVYDFQPVLEHHSHSARARQLIISVLGGTENTAAASPITHVSSEAPPTLLIHGDADTTVPLPVAVDFNRRLLAAGVPSQLIVYPGAGHADILFRALTERPPRLFNDIVHFALSCTAITDEAEVPAGDAAFQESVV